MHEAEGMGGNHTLGNMDCNMCESTAAEAANDRQMTENECRRKAELESGPLEAAERPHTEGHRTHTGNTQTDSLLSEARRRYIFFVLLRNPHPVPVSCTVNSSQCVCARVPFVLYTVRDDSLRTCTTRLLCS